MMTMSLENHLCSHEVMTTTSLVRTPFVPAKTVSMNPSQLGRVVTNMNERSNTTKKHDANKIIDSLDLVDTIPAKTPVSLGKYPESQMAMTTASLERKTLKLFHSMTTLLWKDRPPE
ncbi:hypothetical protein L917_05159 [Phytophthora nicotianae]|uniref:Uncharacterized protein n=1 Tax=Phytophthora nicotianae TaxID=4792 RepID=W2NQ77_PHYNI|nr:hypothetical protein L915_05321 [Phytophthora nicotianae]ETL44425.1 hypothetical protein L916_05277 [Phytophthora nicotianae]ETL97597.1 hypothetical protein L917_05159 [Phytophthora nicotianae]ETM50756.1 hypothetical protein L914_05276 [Phytophthora nicotianae]